MKTLQDLYFQLTQAEDMALVYDIHIQKSPGYYVNTSLADGTTHRTHFSDQPMYKTTVTFHKSIQYETLVELKKYIEYQYKSHIKSIDCHVEYRDWETDRKSVV